MSKIPGSLPITGFIGTTFAADTYPTHIDELGKGGYRSVANIQARDAISVERRSIGILGGLVMNFGKSLKRYHL